MINKQFEINRLTAEAVKAGAYFWLRAEGPAESLESAMQRMAYSKLNEALLALGAPVPAPAVLYEAAARQWPKAKLHAGPAEVAKA